MLDIVFEWPDRALYAIFRHVSAFCVSAACSLCCIVVDRTERADNIRKCASAGSRGYSYFTLLTNVSNIVSGCSGCAARLRTVTHTFHNMRSAGHRV